MKTWKARLELAEDGSWVLDATSVPNDKLRDLADALFEASEAIREEAAVNNPLRFLERDARGRVGRSIDAATSLERKVAHENAAKRASGTTGLTTPPAEKS